VSCALLPISLLSPLYKLQNSFVLVDPNLPDMPIVHASEGFLKLTGRPRSFAVLSGGMGGRGETGQFSNLSHHSTSSSSCPC